MNLPHRRGERLQGAFPLFLPATLLLIATLPWRAGAEEPPRAAAPERAVAPAPAAPAASPPAAPAGPELPAASPPQVGPPAPGTSPVGTPQALPTEIQLSFSGANVDVVMKWLAEVTGKSIAKHKGVQCQLTVMSPKKLPVREAVQLVYRALALEGFSAVETRNVILIVPEALELKAAAAELVDGEQDGPLEGKQVLVKIFRVEHGSAERMKERVKGVLTEKGKIEVDEEGQKLIATDYADNLQLLGQVLKELDVASGDEASTEVIPLRNVLADELAPILLSVFAEGGKAPPASGAPAGSRPAGIPVRVLSDKIGNRLIVTAPKEKMPEVKSFIASLDAERRGDLAMRVIPLEHAQAKDVALEVGPLYQKAHGTARGFLEISASPRANALIVLSSQADYEAVRTLVGSLDTAPGEKQSPVRIFRLEHAAADKVRDIIKPLLGVLGKVEIDEAARRVIITDTADNLHLFETLVKELDQPAAEDFLTEVMALRHAQAEDLAAILNGVFGDGARGAASTPPAAGPLKPGGVRVLFDKIGNRIVVTASKEKMPEVKALVSLLDAEKPADLALRVIPLKFVSAKDLAQELGPMYQKVQAPLKELIEISANSRSNSLIVLASKANFDAIKEIVAILDTKDAEEKTMKVFALKSADAEDVATQLTELYRSRDDSYDGYYYFYSSRRSRSQQEGQVRFVADRRRNAVIAIAPAGALDKIESMLRVLDEPVEGEQLVPKIYVLKFVSALDVETVLNELFLKKRRQRGYFDYEFGSEEEDRDIGRLYGKVRIASEPYTNSLIVTSNSTENFAAVEEILKQLDVPSQTGASTLYIQLKYGKAVTIANNINILFAQPGSPPRRQGQPETRQGGATPQQQDNQRTMPSTSFELEEEVTEESYFPWLGGGGSGQQETSRFGGTRTTTTRPVSDLVGKVRVVPDVRTNSLMITSNLHFFPQVIKVVEDLDIPTAQVLIEAKIIEVGRDGRERLGVRWSPDGAQVFDREDLDDSIIANTSTQYREIFAGSALADAMRTGLLDVRVDLDFLIQFLVKNIDSRVRAEPRINVADNERGKLFVGSRVPFISNSLTTPEGGRNDAFQYIDVGIILEVTPHINNKDEVDLKVRVESSQLRQGETLFGGAIIDTRNYRTDISVASGQTLVLGGIIQREESQIVRKFPILGDIPFIGWLFKKRDVLERDVELMVFLRPTVTQGPEDVKALMEAEDQKTPQIRRWREQLDAEREKLNGELPKGSPESPPRTEREGER